MCLDSLQKSDHSKLQLYMCRWRSGFLKQLNSVLPLPLNHLLLVQLSKIFGSGANIFTVELNVLTQTGSVDTDHDTT